MRLHWTEWLLILCLAAGIPLAVDAFWIEPYRLETTHYVIHANTPGFGTTPLKIAELTDLHTTGVGRLERRLLAQLDAERPDVILITGDTIAAIIGTYGEVHELLRRFHAPLGVWLVRGNWENSRPEPNERAFYASAGVHFLLNESRPLRPGTWVAGLDDPSSGQPDLKAALRGIPPGAYTIVMFHAPAYFDEIAGRIPLVLAGHTHGGQVRIPLMRPFWLPRGSGRFLAGWYEENGSRMYVSRGIGTSNLPIRFLCRPELPIITVEP